MSLIKCTNLSLGYDNHVIFGGLNLEINQGDYLSIIGENGSGKSTLIKTILGLIPPLEGRFVFADGLKPNEIGYLPQQIEVQKDFPASVFEIVLSGSLNSLGYNPFYNRKQKLRAMENLKKFGIDNLASVSFRNLSGGQQQRVLLARALCATGKMLLLDEPAAGLDAKVTDELYLIIKELNEKEGMSVIMISHDISAALKYSSHILQIGEGGVLYTGKTSSFSLAADKSQQ